MDKIFEFNVQDERLKKYLEDCLTEDKIEYEFKVEDRWLYSNKGQSEHYQVHCLYANNEKLDIIKQYVKDFENGEIITEGIDELENADEEKNKKSKIFIVKKIVAYIFTAMFAIAFLMGILTFVL